MEHPPADAPDQRATYWHPAEVGETRLIL